MSVDTISQGSARRALGRITESFSGSLHVSASRLDGTDLLRLGEEEIIATASVIKVPILLAALRQIEIGALDPAQLVDLAGHHGVHGSGVLRLLSPTLRLPLLDALRLMIVVSDNVATNAVLEQLGGADEVNRLLGDLQLGRVRLHHPVDIALISKDPASLGTAPVDELRSLMLQIANRGAVSGTVSSTAEEILSRQMYLDLVPRQYRLNPYADELDSNAPLSVASKSGFVPGARVDIGIVRWNGGGFVYACAAVGSHDLAFGNDAEPSVVLGEVGRVLLDEYWDLPGRPPLSDPR